MENEYLASREAARVNPLSVNARIGLARVALELTLAGHSDLRQEVIDEHRAAVALMPNFYEPYNFLAEAYLKLGQHNRALEAIEASLEITWGPQGVLQALDRSGWAFYLQGIAHRELGEMEQAVVSLEQALVLSLSDSRREHAQEVLVDIRGQLEPEGGSDEEAPG